MTVLLSHSSLPSGTGSQVTSFDASCTTVTCTLCTVAALALLAWDILTTLDDEVSFPDPVYRGVLTVPFGPHTGQPDLAVSAPFIQLPSAVVVGDPNRLVLRSTPLRSEHRTLDTRPDPRRDRSAWTPPKALYLFVRYYSLIALM